jgi:hypothetical protein
MRSMDVPANQELEPPGMGSDSIAAQAAPAAQHQRR